MMEDAFKPKKRIFMALTSVSALIGAITHELHAIHK